MTPYLTSTGFDLLCRLLCFDPSQRITAVDALAHPWFDEVPHAQDPQMMPTFPSMNEDNLQRQRAKEGAEDIKQVHKKYEKQGFFFV